MSPTTYGFSEKKRKKILQGYSLIWSYMVLGLGWYDAQIEHKELFVRYHSQYRNESKQPKNSLIDENLEKRLRGSSSLYRIYTGLCPRMESHNIVHNYYQGHDCCL